MRSCREKEIKFLVRTLVRNLRIGAMMRTILPALAQAIVMNLIEGSTENLKEHLQVVAIDRKEGKLKSFQDLSTQERGSKGSFVAADKIKVEICIFAFDIMFVNGRQLLTLPLRERRKHIKDVFAPEKPGYFEYAKEITVKSEDASEDDETTLTRMNSFLNNAVHSACEGIMVKSLDIKAGYTPSKRSDSWLKVKKDYVEGLGDSLDLVPIGAWHGNGRKKDWYSPFLMACYNTDTQQFQSVCRVMSGFSDSFRCRINVTATDHSGSFQATIYDEIVENMLGHNTHEMYHMTPQDMQSLLRKKHEEIRLTKFMAQIRAPKKNATSRYNRLTIQQLILQDTAHAAPSEASSETTKETGGSSTQTEAVAANPQETKKNSQDTYSFTPPTPLKKHKQSHEKQE